jgi:hypothetical protein
MVNIKNAQFANVVGEFFEQYKNNIIYSLIILQKLRKIKFLLFFLMLLLILKLLISL